MEAVTGGVLCVLLGLPCATKASEMEMFNTWKAPSFADKLGRACAGLVVRPLVRFTAASVACDGVTDTVFPAGKSTDTLRVSVADAATGVMVVTVLRGAVTCFMAVETS